jgi:chemotaxis protein CheD
MSGADLMVRMGELAVSTSPDDVLTSIGLGSCIGLALVDVERQVAGLAHVMLPTRPEQTADAAVGKFADTAVPALLEAVLTAGARRPRLATYVVGGAQMFSFGGRGMDVGRRNDEAVREALAALHLRILADETGGTKGRTIRVWAADGRVSVKASGGVETTISPAGTRAARPPLGGAPATGTLAGARGPAPSRVAPTRPSPAREVRTARTTPVRVPAAAPRSDASSLRDASGGARPIPSFNPLRGV